MKTSCMFLTSYLVNNFAERMIRNLENIRNIIYYSLNYTA